MENQNKKIIWPVLLVDDEWGDIQDLDNLLEQVGVRMNLAEEKAMTENYSFIYTLPNARIREYAAHPGEAVRIMAEAMQNRERFSALIVDNHMKGEGGESIFGEDFLRIIKGLPVYCSSKDESDLEIALEEIGAENDFENVLRLGSSRRLDEEVLDFLNDNFNNPQQYVSLVRYYFGNKDKNPLLIMLCGNPGGADLTGIEDDVYLYAKQIGRERGYKTFCEKDVLYLLAERCILPAEFVWQSIDEHPRLGKGIHPNQQEFRDPKKRKKQARRNQ